MLDRKNIITQVLATREIIMDQQSAQQITVKGDADFVTAVDFAVQDFLQKKLYEIDPSIEMIAEEKENVAFKEDGRYWILDPIDGTTNLIHQYGLSAVSLALYEKGEIAFGIVYNPFTNEVFTAEKGKGACLNGRTIRVSDRNMKDSVISYGSSPYGKQDSENTFQLFSMIFQKCADFRRFASAALDLCYVACGRSDGYLEGSLKPWDYAAGSLILKEAGGIVTDWQGEALPFFKNSGVYAATPMIHQELWDIIQEWKAYNG